uniref:SHSP domain-containing protein n=1 Tax=Myripristis murdjan TaxID=586833 RepID=A0A667ZZK8_9TELE
PERPNNKGWLSHVGFYQRCKSVEPLSVDCENKLIDIFQDTYRVVPFPNISILNLTVLGAVRSLGDSYYMSADVSQFEPHDVVVMAYNHHVVIHAEKVLEDGSVSDTFTHKSLFPEDMDPLSVSGTLNPDGILVVSVRRSDPHTGWAGAPGLTH